jgi:flagellar basal-body rod modification protein FlgD
MADSIIGTSNVWPNYSSVNKSSELAGQNNIMGKDQFLQILIAQIKNQDPMKPLEDKEFIAQMAQFTSVEQLMNMAKSLEGLSNSIGMASSLIDKTIGWEAESIGTQDPVAMTGVVDSITVRDGLTYAVVGGQEIALSRIAYVTNTASGTSNNEQGEEGQ